MQSSAIDLEEQGPGGMYDGPGGGSRTVVRLVDGFGLRSVTEIRDVEIYAARHVLPVSSPPRHDGAVAVESGKIVAVGTRREITTRFDEADNRDLGDAVILPGLVNAHTHLELSWMADDPPPGGDYLTWLRGFVARRDRESEDAARNATGGAIDAIIARGTVAVGDVANRTWTAGLLAATSLWGVVFLEVFDFRAAEGERVLEEAAKSLDVMDRDARAARGRIRVALSPHAPHTTSPAILKAVAGGAAAAGGPLTIHLAESREEVEFLQTGSGEYGAFLRERGLWDDTWSPPHQSPVQYVDRLHALTPNTLVVHCVHLDHADLSLLQSRGVSVVTCPRSNERLGVGVAPTRKLLGSGVPVALGTDSLASVPDLDMFAEMAALVRLHPEVAPAAALRIATLNGARALGLGEMLGAIEPGRAAALVAVPLADPGDDPLETILSTPEQVWCLQDGAGDAPWA